MGGKATKIRQRVNKGAGRPRKQKETCTMDGCANVRAARGLCHAHYSRFHREGTLVEFARDRIVELHGQVNSRIYNIWQLMRSRCENPKNKNYHRYGGRGISYAPEWKKFSAFFDWAMSNGYSDELTIDRIDNNGDYEPSNCRWATMLEQSRNKEACVKVMRHDGKVYGSVKEAAEDNGIIYQTLYKACKGNRGIHGGPAWKTVGA